MNFVVHNIFGFGSNFYNWSKLILFKLWSQDSLQLTVRQVVTKVTPSYTNVINS